MSNDEHERGKALPEQRTPEAVRPDRDRDECPVTGDIVDNSVMWHCPDCEREYRPRTGQAEPDPNAKTCEHCDVLHPAVHCALKDEPCPPEARIAGATVPFNEWDPMFDWNIAHIDGHGYYACGPTRETIEEARLDVPPATVAGLVDALRYCRAEAERHGKKPAAWAPAVIDRVNHVLKEGAYKPREADPRPTQATPEVWIRDPKGSGMIANVAACPPVPHPQACPKCGDVQPYGPPTVDVMCAACGFKPCPTKAEAPTLPDPGCIGCAMRTSLYRCIPCSDQEALLAAAVEAGRRPDYARPCAHPLDRRLGSPERIWCADCGALWHTEGPTKEGRWQLPQRAETAAPGPTMNTKERG